MMGSTGDVYKDNSSCNSNNNNDDSEKNKDEEADDDVQQSRQKLEQSSRQLTTKLRNLFHDGESSAAIRIRSLPCTTREETQSYRCKCSFQILLVPDCDSDNKKRSCFQYALRRRQQSPLVIQTFPLANERIQRSMTMFRDDILNKKSHEPSSTLHSSRDDSVDPASTFSSSFSVISQHLTSCTFSSSWNQQHDCILTLHYHSPPLPTCQWQHQAQQMCRLLSLKQVNGRSRGRIISATLDSATNENEGGMEHFNRMEITLNPSNNIISHLDTNNTLSDTAYLIQRTQQRYNFREHDHSLNDDHGNPIAELEWHVTLHNDAPNYSKNENSDNDDDTTTITSTTSTNSADATITCTPVYYSKPETAFFHPNPNVMTQALTWMIQRIQTISSSILKKNPLLNLLELYCGCGAHTVALAKTGLLQRIVAIELDPRLVQACQHNIQINNVQHMVTIQQQDAGKFFASQTKHHQQRQQPQQQETKTMLQQQQKSTMKQQQLQQKVFQNEFDILLVDPPRQGLDPIICNMVLQQQQQQQSFSHLLYISCGHDALLRDLDRLCSTGSRFEDDSVAYSNDGSSYHYYTVVHCLQLDLFPGTYSIETLVHLQKVRKPG
jgi:16S rRNA G966 N2-methylase RsmD